MKKRKLVAVVAAAALAATAAGGATAHGRPGAGTDRASGAHAIKVRGAHGLFKVVTDYLGLTPRALLEQLRAGKSLAQIAVAQGKTAAGLKQAILIEVKAHLDRAVAAGRLSADREQTFLAKLSTWLDTFLNKTWTGKKTK